MCFGSANTDDFRAGTSGVTPWGMRERETERERERGLHFLSFQDRGKKERNRKRANNPNAATLMAAHTDKAAIRMMWLQP